MAPRPGTRDRVPWGAAILVGVLVVLVRTLWLHRLGLHWDEDISSLAARGILETGLPSFPSERLYWRAPLYHYLLAPFVAAGVDWVPRILGVALAGLTGGLILRFGREVVGQRAALIGALLFAVSIVEISLARQIRMYALYQPLALLALHEMYRLWTTGEMRRALRSAALILVSMTAHELGATLALLYLPIAVRATRARVRAFCVAAVPVFVGLGWLQRKLVGTAFAGDRAGIVEPGTGAGAVGGPDLFRIRIGTEPLFFSGDLFGPALAVGLLGLAALIGVLLGISGSRGRPLFLRAAAGAGLAAAFAAAGGTQIGLALAILFLLGLQRDSLFPGRRGTRALLAGLLLVLGAGAAWTLPALAGGYGLQDVLLGMLRAPGRMAQTLLWPPLIGGLAALAAILVAARAFREKPGDGARFLIVAVSWMVVVRSLLSSSVQTRYLTELLPLWELAAGCGAVLLIGGGASQTAASLRRRLAPATGIALILAALLLPGTGLRQTLAYLSRGHGESVRAGYQLRTAVPDLRTATAWLKPRMAPADQIVATDWLTTRFYLGRVDGWLRSEAYRWQSVIVEGAVRDCYIGAEVIPDLGALQAFLERGPTWVVLDGTEIGPEDANILPEIRRWLLEQDPVWVAAEGATRILRFGADRPVLQLPDHPFDVGIAAGPPIDTLAASSAATPRFGVAEIHLEADRVFDGEAGSPNPFVEAVLSAAVTAPSGRAYEVAGFFDGDGLGGAIGSVFKFRICPDEVGVWEWRTRSDLPELDGRSGAFLCKGELRGRFQQGAIVIDPERPRAFRLREGDPLYLIGKFLDVDAPGRIRFAHTLFSDRWTDEDRAARIERHLGMGCNKINLYVANRGDYGGIATTPWIGTAARPDRERFDLSWWRHAERWIRLLRDEGIAAQIWFFADDSNFGELTAGERSLLIRAGMARLSAFSNTLFILALEWQEDWSREEVEAQMRVLHAANPWGRLATVHGTTGDFAFPEAEWADFLDVQAGNDADAFEVRRIGLANRALAEKPLLQEEFGLGVEDAGLRKKTWAAFTAGAAGSGTGAYLLPFSRFVAGIPFAEMEPADSLVVAGIGWCRAAAGREYVVYLPEGGSVTLALQGAGARDSLAVAWFDPRTGGSIRRPAVAPAEQREFAAPGDGDWVLRLTGR